jgi:hypothetical protein
MLEFVGRVSASVTRHRANRRVTAQKPRLTRPTATASIMGTLFCGAVPSTPRQNHDTFSLMSFSFSWFRPRVPS